MDLLDGNGTLGSGTKRFRTEAGGKRVFYPIMFSRGYVLTTEKTERRLRNLSVTFNLFCLASFFLLHWHIIIWSLVFLPAAWAAFMALNLFVLRHCATTDTGQPEKKPDKPLQVLLSGAVMTSCLFGTLLYLNRWPSISTLFMVFWAEWMIVAVVFAGFALRAAMLRKSAIPENNAEGEK